MKEQQWDDTPIAAAARRAAKVKSRTGLKLPKPESTRVLSVANQKGGVGKTTSTVNLACALAMHGLKVLVVDLDPQGNASTGLDVEHRAGTNSSYEVLIGNCTPEEAIQKSPASENLDCIPATIDLAGAEIELVSLVRREYRLSDALNEGFLKRHSYDYVFVDCPPSLGLLTINAQVFAKEVLIPIQCEYYALEGVGQLLTNISMIRRHLNSDLHISAILLTMYDARTNLSHEVATNVRDYFGDVVLGNVIPRNVKVSEAPGFSKTVLNHDPGSPGAMAYMDAAKELALRGDYQPVPDTGPIGVSPAYAEQVRMEQAAQKAEEKHDSVAEDSFDDLSAELDQSTNDIDSTTEQGDN